MGADSKSTTYEELSNLTKIHATTISSNLKFLHRIEFITSKSIGSSIQLSSIGIEFVQALIMKDEDRQREILKSKLTDNFSDILSFYELHQQNDDLDFEMIFNQIKLLSNAPDVSNKTGNTYPGYRVGIYTFIKMLIFTGLINKKYDPEINSMAIIKDKSAQPRTRAEVPLSCSIEWMKRLFTAINNINPETIPRAFITANVTAHNHESSVLSVARFLELVDKEGNRSANYDKLRLYGNEEFSKNLAEIIKEKYAKIFSLTDISTVERKNIETVFMKEYNLGNAQAINAIGVLTNLCQLANIPISESLSSKKKSTEKSIKPKNLPQKRDKIEPVLNKESSTIVQQTSTENPFKINLNFNVEVKDKESMESAIEFIKNLKKEIKAPLPELNVRINEESLD